MIDLGTLAGLLEHRQRLDACCPRCDRWRELPLANLVARRQGSRRLPIAVRRQVCGEVGRLQVRPPVPAHRPGGWMESQQQKARHWAGLVVALSV